MKVLHIINTDGIAGAEKHLLQLLPGLRKKQTDISLLIICPPSANSIFSDFAETLIGSDVPVTIFTSTSFISFSLLQKMRNHIVTGGFYYIHTHLIRTDLLLVLLRQRYRRKVFHISTIHGYQEDVAQKFDRTNIRIIRNKFYYLVKFVLRYIDLPLTVSDSMARFFLDYKLTKKLMAVVKHGVDIQLPSRAATNSIIPGRLLVLGRLTPIKGQHLLLQAMPGLLMKHPGCTLEFVGTGPFEGELRRITNSLGINNQVIFSGFSTQPAKELMQADIIVIPSLHESFGLVFLEAMALKKAIVAFDIPISIELIQDQINGCVVQKGNVTQLGNTLDSLLNSPERKMQIEAKAFSTWQTYYTKEIMVTNMLNLYNTIV